MTILKLKDGTEIFYKDWGQAQPIVFSHGWPLTSDDWDAQMVFLAAEGFRVIAQDRRGHGRSSQTCDCNDMDTYADDLAQLVEALDLSDAIHVGHSTAVARSYASSAAPEPTGCRCRAAWRRDVAHAENRRQSGWRTHGGFRRHPCVG